MHHRAQRLSVTGDAPLALVLLDKFLKSGRNPTIMKHWVGDIVSWWFGHS
jgi:hypothetical protein